VKKVTNKAMEEDDNKQNQRQHNFPFHHDIHEHHIVDDSSSSQDNLAMVLRNLGTTIKRQQQETSTMLSSSSSSSVLKSVREESFASRSSSTSSFATATMETTGGNGMLTDDENKNDFLMMKMSACPTGKVVTMPKQQQSNIASSLEMMKRVKTLSFLHNEDLLTSNTRPLLAVDDKPQTPLFRSMSFQERKQYQHQTSLKRVESGKELKVNVGGESSNFRKVTILSPKHSLQELNERIKQMQQQMFYGSSELSL
jgi:hypothetical protein